MTTSPMSEDLIVWLQGVLDEDLRQAESDLFADRITVERARMVKFDIEAKRQLIYTAVATREEADAALGNAVAIVASAYRDRDGYREEWRP